VNSNGAEQVYQEILARTESMRKRKNLKNIWDALEHLRLLKSQDFSIASVARAIAAIGRPGPKEQSIRNAEGQDFREVIAAYSSHFGSIREVRPPSLSEDLIASIGDLRTAALVQTVLNENTSLKRRLDLLKNQFLKLAPVDIGLASEPARRIAEQHQLPSPGATFTAMEVAATASFLENIRKNREDLQLEFELESGALLWRGGVLELANSAFYHALQKIVKNAT
jgi:hypothetical protein